MSCKYGGAAMRKQKKNQRWIQCRGWKWNTESGPNKIVSEAGEGTLKSTGRKLRKAPPRLRRRGRPSDPLLRRVVDILSAGAPPAGGGAAGADRQV